MKLSNEGKQNAFMHLAATIILIGGCDVTVAAKTRFVGYV